MLKRKQSGISCIEWADWITFNAKYCQYTRVMINAGLHGGVSPSFQAIRYQSHSQYNKSDNSFVSDQLGLLEVST